MRAVKLAYAVVALLGLAGCSNELKVTGVEPAQGTYAGGEDVVIKGNGFQPGRGGVTVKFGKHDATAVVVAAADKIHVSTPGGDPNTTVDVTVIFDDGKAFKVGNGFHYMAPVDNRGTLDKAFNQMGKDTPGTPGTTPATTPPKK
ncbi:MAG: hypothetical protein JWN44_4412 [Myxococcales bacterium]|nr:hypothetical protein [Myxococcales bacterium]